MNLSGGISRRATLKLALLFNAVVGIILAVPFVRYIFSPVIRERRPGYASWISLGTVDKFPTGETRLATYRNPISNPWDGQTADIACWVRHIDAASFQV